MNFDRHHWLGVPAEGIAPAHADEDAFDAPGADVEGASGEGRGHATARNHVPDLQGIVRRRLGGGVGHQGFLCYRYSIEDGNGNFKGAWRQLVGSRGTRQTNP